MFPEIMQVPTFENFLKEMASPSASHRASSWFHGTSKDHIQKILKDKELQPSEAVTKTTRRLMSPVFGKVYLTADPAEAVRYAYFRSSADSSAYLIVVDGKSLRDVQPDEDVIADLLQTEDTILGFEWLVRMAQYIDPKMWKRFQDMGDYAYSVSLAKKIVKRLSDAQKIEMINKGMKIAHEGGIPISEVWELPSVRSEEFDPKIQEKDYYKKLGKRIF